MTNFRFIAVKYLRANSLTEICNLANRNYKGYTSDERKCLIALARVVTKEILEKRKEEREKNV